MTIPIALVEDDSDLLASTVEFLTTAGYRIWGVNSAEAFYRRFAIDPVNIVIMDINLPSEDGLSAASFLSQKRDIAVILLSARDTVEDRLAGLKAGADRYLVKPVSLLELAANIDAVASRLGQSSTISPVAPLPVLAPTQVITQVTRNAITMATTMAPAPTTVDEAERIWVLNQCDWLLTDPQGRSVSLTAKEFCFAHRVIQAEGQTVPKRELADEIFGHRVPNGNERLNVLLARLRKKAVSEFGYELPVKTAHQIGYAFTEKGLVS